MKYRIAYDTPGRLRLRSGGGVFSEKQELSLETMLADISGVISVNASYVNGGILVMYSGDIKEDFETCWRCTSSKCDIRLTLTDGTVWSKIKDRTLFIFRVNSFLNRPTTDSVVNDTGGKRSTAEKYLTVIKNALLLDVEEGINVLMLWDEDVKFKLTSPVSSRESTTLVEN